MTMGDECSSSLLEPRRISVIQEPGHLVARGSVQIARSLPVPEVPCHDKMSVQIPFMLLSWQRSGWGQQFYSSPAHLAFASVEIYPVLTPNVAHYLWLSTRSDTSSHALDSQKPPHVGALRSWFQTIPTHQYNPIFKQRNIFQDYTNCSQRCP